MTDFLRHHQVSAYLVGIGLALLLAAGRSAFMAWGEDPSAESRLERGLANYGNWVLPLLYVGGLLLLAGILILGSQLLFSGQ